MSFLSKLLNRINILPIINSHISTLYDYNLQYNEGKNKFSIYDKLLFVYFPPLFSLLLVFGIKPSLIKIKLICLLHHYLYLLGYY